MRRRRINPIGLSFLDAMTCGLGAVILLFMIINAAVRDTADRVTSDLTAEVNRLQQEVLDGHRNLVEVRNAVADADRDRVLARGLARRLTEALEEIRVELATYENQTLARREHLEQLQTDLRTLENEARRLSASRPSEETPGDRVRSFVGDGDRQYLTGLKVGGRRILLLVDSSASMLGTTLVNIVRRRNLPPEQRVRAGKWRQALDTVDWLTTQIPPTSSFQIYRFSTTARPVVAGSDGRWLDGGDRQTLDDAVEGLRSVAPADGTSLLNAFAVVGSLNPRPDNIILLTDGLPTVGRGPTRAATVSPRQRERHFKRAIEELPSGIPVNVILFPIEGDPMAASAFWKLAIATRGSLVSLAEDWP